VNVWGPKGLGDYWGRFLASMKADIDIRVENEGRSELRGLLQIHIIDEGVVLEHNGLAVSAIRTEHLPLMTALRCH